MERPPAQLELDLSREVRPPLRERCARAGRAVLLWTPVWVPLGFLVQLLVAGMRPALAERARLDRAESEVHARVEALRREEREIDTDARMLADDVYRERVRRSLLDPAAEPLTLERARPAVGP